MLPYTNPRGRRAIRLPRGCTVIGRMNRQKLRSKGGNHSSCVDEEAIDIVPLAVPAPGTADVHQTAIDALDTARVHIRTSCSAVIFFSPIVLRNDLGCYVGECCRHEWCRSTRKDFVC